MLCPEVLLLVSLVCERQGCSSLVHLLRSCHKQGLTFHWVSGPIHSEKQGPTFYDPTALSCLRWQSWVLLKIKVFLQPGLADLYKVASYSGIWSIPDPSILNSKTRIYSWGSFLPISQRKIIMAVFGRKFHVPEPAFLSSEVRWSLTDL